MSQGESKSTFFRQSGWLVIATVGSGVFMTAVHTVASQMANKSEYGVFGALLRMLLLLTIPAAGLQTVFVHQAASAVTPEDDRALRGTIRNVCAAITLAWAALLLVVFFLQANIQGAFKITHVSALWMMLGVVLSSLWAPVIRGVLQGKQNFLGLGWVVLLDGIIRFGMVTFLVVGLKFESAGAMFGALLGQLVSLALGLWYCRDLFQGERAPFAWRKWLKEVTPLVLGGGTMVLFSTFDVPYVQWTYTADQAPFYLAGQNIGFALMQFAGPLAMVMFPKLIRSAAKAEKTDALKLALLATTAFGIVGALACTLLPGLPVHILYFRKPELWVSSQLVPYFAWSMVFLMMANVVISGLLARKRFAFIPWLMLLAAVYVGTLLYLRPKLAAMEIFTAYRTIALTLGAFNAVLLALSVWFAWGRKDQPLVKS